MGFMPDANIYIHTLQEKYSCRKKITRRCVWFKNACRYKKVAKHSVYSCTMFYTFLIKLSRLYYFVV